MTANTDRASAKIIQFPARGRFAAATPSDEVEAYAAMDAPRARIAMGSGWYHDEAIKEEQERGH
jgi:hypothetical protein